jgi:hypothetical protein
MTQRLSLSCHRPWAGPAVAVVAAAGAADQVHLAELPLLALPPNAAQVCAICSNASRISSSLAVRAMFKHCRSRRRYSTARFVTIVATSGPYMTNATGSRALMRLPGVLTRRLREAILVSQISAFDVAELMQRLAKHVHTGHPFGGARTPEHPDHWHRHLLRARRDRPRRRAAERR